MMKTSKISLLIVVCGSLWCAAVFTACSPPDEDTFQVRYSAAGGMGVVPEDNNSYAQGDRVTVKGNTGGLTLQGKTFNG